MKLIKSSILIWIICSCQPKQPESEQKGIEDDEILSEVLETPFDTSEVISKMNITENFSQMESINENIEGLEENIDTLELTYYFGFCDCQSWVLSDIHDQAKQDHSDLDELDPRGQIQFNLDDHGFYLEPASEELEMDWRTEVNGTHIRVIGREYKEKGVAGGFTVPDPPEGRVFRYYSYEFIRPYYVWGPEYVYDTTSTGEKLTAPTTLTVK